ncbi:hypothetical protein RCL1_008472 [Eukaryota sp. TZLM3-RCL]
MKSNLWYRNRRPLFIFAGVSSYALALFLVWGLLANPSSHVIRNAYGEYFVDGTAMINFESCTEQAEKEGANPLISSFRHDIPGIEDVLQKNAINGNDIILLLTNSGFSHFTSNFLCITDELGIDKIVLATTDMSSAEYFRAQNRSIVFDPLRVFGTDTNQFGSEEHRNIASSKIFFVYEILRRGYNVFLSDVDIVIFDKKVFEHVKDNHPADLVIQSDSPPPYNSRLKLNTGFFYIRSNARTLKFLEKVMMYRLQHPEKHEQEALNNVLAKGEQCINVAVLDRYLYPNGHMYFTYKMCEKADIQPKIVHVNYYQSDSKVALLKHHKWWKIDSEQKCINSLNK